MDVGIRQRVEKTRLKRNCGGRHGFQEKNGSKETGGTEEYNTSSNEDQEKWSKAKSNSWSFYLPFVGVPILGCACFLLL